MNGYSRESDFPKSDLDKCRLCSVKKGIIPITEPVFIEHSWDE